MRQGRKIAAPASVNMEDCSFRTRNSSGSKSRTYGTKAYRKWLSYHATTDIL
jgi:hypothetical protein